MRTTDAETGVGCIITNRDNRIIGTGYNGHAARIDWTKLPNTRPDKYPWIIHAEENAVKNCQVKPDDAIAYVSVPPCFNCLYHWLWPGIREVYYVPLPDGRFSYFPQDEPLTLKFLELTNMKYEPFTPNFDFVTKIVKDLVDKGLINKTDIISALEGL